MKRCPQCNRVETDEGLVYCRVDGAALVSESSVADDANTKEFGSSAVSSEIATSILPHRTDAKIKHATAPTTVLSAQQPPATTQPLSKQSRRTFILASVTLGLAVIVVVGYFNFWRKSEAVIQSIAVLPFANPSKDPNTDYLSDGIPENIINSLSQLPHLKVMSRNSAFHYKGKDVDVQTVAKDLQVQAVLTGRVEQRGDSLTISVELINAQDNSQIWGQQYNRKLADVFVVQSEIAREISDKLRLKLSTTEQQQIARRPTDNLKAFQFYIQGRTLAARRTREDLLNAMDLYEKAIAEDGNYALAYTGLADAYANLGVRSYMDPSDGRRKADDAARKALALDQNLAEAHFAVSQAKVLFAPYDLPLAKRELEHALELSPSLAMAHQYLGILFAVNGQLDQSLGEYSKARELDPFSASIARGAAFPYYLRRDYPRSLEMLQRANQLGPPFSVFWEVQVYTMSGRYEEALAELSRARQTRKVDEVLTFSEGLIYAAQGKRTEALRVVKELEQITAQGAGQAQYLARIHVALGNKDEAIVWLQKGLETGALTGFYPDDPIWDPIRGDQRFGDLVQRSAVKF